LLPRFTALYSDGETDKASKLFNKINLFVAILVFSIMANMSFFPKELIWIWTGNMELATQTRIYIPVLAFSAAMLSLQIIPFNIAIANGYTKLNNILGVVSLFITLPGYWFATKNYGAIGAAWVYCVVQFLITLIYLYIINNKFIKVKSVSVLYVGQMLFPLLLSLAVAFGFSFIPDWAKNSRIVSLVWIGMATFFTICVSVLFLVPKAEKRKAINLMLQFKNKIR
jgi:O-antigen/teichoic acid export membrane protein